jgi:hypothetical protein
MTLEEVIEECKLFYFAGMETTSVLLGGTKYASRVAGPCKRRGAKSVWQKQKPEFDDLSRLKIVSFLKFLNFVPVRI